MNVIVICPFLSGIKKGKSMKVNRKGFTLIELLVVIGILAVLLSIVLIAINPAKQFAQANNTKRSSDVNAILNAISQYQADNRGQLPPGISSTSAQTIGSSGGVDLCSYLVSTYIAQMPVDPTTGTWTSCASYNTGYEVSRSSTNNRVTVSAPNAELSATITVTR